MEENISKKSYYLPNELMKSFAEWCKPGRDYSPKIAGLILAGMAIDDPSLLEQLCKMAYMEDINKVRIKAKKIIVDSLLNAELLQMLQDIPALERTKVVSAAICSIKEVSEKK